jgi:hypothetical protein
MLEASAAKYFIWQRIISNPGLFAQYPQFQQENFPVYWGAAEQNAPELYATFTMLGASDVLTQQKSKEYVDVDIILVVTNDARGDNVAFLDASGDHEFLAHFINRALTDNLAPENIGVYDPSINSTVNFDVTCDRLSFKSFMMRENGVRQDTVDARYLIRVQRKVG